MNGKRKFSQERPLNGVPGTSSAQVLRSHLPIAAVKEELLNEIRAVRLGGGTDSIIVMGETGSGKTTQIPQFLLDSRLGGDGLIGVTQPRRVAAVSLAARVAEERGEELGHSVGYAVRFDAVSSPDTRILFQTDGMLLREAMKDCFLNRYSVIVLDEAHERTLHTDVLFGVVVSAQRSRRNRILQGVKGCSNLLLVIMSATMDVDHFSQYFGGAPVAYVEGREFRVSAFHVAEPVSDFAHAALVSVFQIHKQYKDENTGGILVFLTGQEEIESAVRKGREIAKHPSLNGLPKMIFLPLYAGLHTAGQMRVFDHVKGDTRKVIFATNIAETSLTIPGIGFVVDSGKVKMRHYDAAQRLDMLRVVNVSAAQAAQRAGRAGRESDGFAFRLFSEAALHSFAPFPKPEILRCNLASVILELISMHVDIRTFNFMDKPDEASIQSGLEELELLGALEKADDDSLKLSDMGRQMAAFPLDPKLARALLAGVALGCGEEMVWIVAGLSQGNFFVTATAAATDSARESAHKKFEQLDGDHHRMLAIFRSFHGLGKSEAQQWCKNNFLHERSLSAVRQIRGQLLEICSRQGLGLRSCGANWDLVRRSLCFGLFLNAGMLEPGSGPGGAKYRLFEAGANAKIHPSSCLMGRKPAFILYSELLLTNQVYCREVTSVQAEWLWDAVPEYCREHRIPNS